MREMMENEGDAKPAGKGDEKSTVPSLQGHVVKGEHGTTYVGATHCMAMLEDVSYLTRPMMEHVANEELQIEDLKMYFDDSEEQEEGASPTDELDAPEMLLSPRSAPSNRDELIAQLPERHVADRLITRYFSSMSPSQRQYALVSQLKTHV